MAPLRTKIMYGAGGAVYSVKESAYNMFVLLFYTQVLGLSGAITGLIISISLIWDGISDPLIGTWSDRLHSKYGRRHPFMIASTIPLGLGFYALFAPPGAILENHAYLAMWLLGWSLWIRTLTTCFSIPHLALSAEITEDYHERSKIISYRMGFLFLFAVVIPALALATIFAQNGDQDGRFVASNYPLYGILSCLTVWIFATISTLATRQYMRPTFTDSAEPPPPRTTLLTLLKDMGRTLKNKTFRSILALDISTSVSYGAIATLNILTWTYFWEFSAREIALILAVPSFLAVGLVMATIGPLGRYFQKPTIVRLAILVMLIDMVWLYPIKIAGLLPANGNALNFWLNMAFMLVYMYCFLLRATVLYSIVADVADQHQLEHEQKQEAGFFSMISFTSKAATVIGPVYAGIALDFIGLHRGMLPGEVPQSILNNLVYAMGISAIPALLIALYFAKKITMSRAQVEDVQSEIARRQASR